MAIYIKDEFEKKYGGEYSCIVGINSGYNFHYYTKDHEIWFFLGAYKIGLFDK
jgi:hypothetical protein